MTTIATLAVKLTADSGSFVKIMNDAELQTATWARSVSEKVKSVGSEITNFGKGMTAFITLPLLAAGTSAVKMASDFEDTKNKVNAVFGSMSKEVVAWSKNSATTMGISQLRALDAASSFAIFGKSAGLSALEIANFSKENVKLAGDLASFYGGSVDQALTAMQAALRGEFEPIRKYNVLLNDSVLQQKAVAMGIIETARALSPQEKILAVNAVLWEQTTLAQNDYLNTADSSANKLKTLQAMMVDLSIAIGTLLMPVAMQLIDWMNKAVTWFQLLSPEQQKMIVLIAGIAAVAGPLLVIVGSLVTAIGALIPVITAVGTFLLPFAPYILAIAAVIGILYLAWTQNWFGIQEKTQAAVEYIRGLLASGMQFISDLNSGKLGWISTVWIATWDTIKMYFETVVANIKLILAAFSAAFQGDWRRFGELLREAWDNAWRMMGTIIQTARANFIQIVSHLIKEIAEYFKNIDWEQVGWNLLKGLGMGMLGAIPMLIGIVKNVGSAVMDAFKGFFSIQSPSIKMEREVGWQLAAGQARGYERGVNAMMPSVMSGPSAMSMPAVAGMGAVGGGGGGGQVILNVDYRPLISTADENEAKFVLAPMLEDWLRSYLKK